MRSMYTPNKTFLLIGLLVAAALVAARLGFFMEASDRDMILTPPDCYKIGERITFKDFMNKYLPEIKALGVNIKLPDKVFGKYVPSDVWVCNGNVYIIAYTDGSKIETYFDAPFAVEVAIIPGLNEFHTPVNVRAGETVELDMAYPAKAYRFNEFEVVVIDTRLDKESLFDYMFTAYDLESNVRYNMGFKKGYGFTEKDIMEVLSSFKNL